MVTFMQVLYGIELVLAYCSRMKSPQMQASYTVTESVEEMTPSSKIHAVDF